MIPRKEDIRVQHSHVIYIKEALQHLESGRNDRARTVLKEALGTSLFAATQTWAFLVLDLPSIKHHEQQLCMDPEDAQRYLAHRTFSIVSPTALRHDLLKTSPVKKVQDTLLIPFCGYAVKGDSVWSLKELYEIFEERVSEKEYYIQSWEGQWFFHPPGEKFRLVKSGT